MVEADAGDARFHRRAARGQRGLEIEGVEIALLAEERGSASKFSLRSKERVDVAAQVAAPLGGGGHARAAGCTLQTDLDSALETMLKQARAALEQTGEVQ